MRDLIVLLVESRGWLGGQKVGENFLAVVIIQIVSGRGGKSHKLGDIIVAFYL